MKFLLSLLFSISAYSVELNYTFFNDNCPKGSIFSLENVKDHTLNYGCLDTKNQKFIKGTELVVLRKKRRSFMLKSGTNDFIYNKSGILVRIKSDDKVCEIETKRGLTLKGDQNYCKAQLQYLAKADPEASSCSSISESESKELKCDGPKHGLAFSRNSVSAKWAKGLVKTKAQSPICEGGSFNTDFTELSCPNLGVYYFDQTKSQSGRFFMKISNTLKEKKLKNKGTGANKF